MNENHASIRGKPVETVGVIIVHGIGEQKRFQFLEGETRKIIDAIIAKYDAQRRRRDVTPILTSGASDAFLGDQSSWASAKTAPLRTLVELDDKFVDIGFHEVWWADINEKLTLCKQVRFWLWGLSLPGVAQHKDRFLPGALQRTRQPDHAGVLPCHNRWRMIFVSILFAFSAFSIALINTILKRLDFSAMPLSDTLVNYLSGVKLYSQDKRAGGSPMDGPDEPPRAAIRRRMIRVMVEVASQGYDRWYILAHSLGTVVAWNGLMETSEALPNYLDQACWKALEQNPIRGRSDHDIDIDAMMPNRPAWLDARDIVNRDALFRNFRGVLTYGSPLERFCALWPAMVPINSHEDPFPAGAEWVNVYDPTDPVGTWIYDYDPIPPQHPRRGHTTLKPHNFPCRASPLLLYSHLCYLRGPRQAVPNSDKYLINQVAEWLITGKSLAGSIEDAARTADAFWLPSSAERHKTERLVFGRVIWRAAQDVVVAVLLTLVTVLSLNWVVYPAVKGILAGIGLSSWASAISQYLSDALSSYGFLKEIAILWVAAMIVVAVASCIQNLLSTRDHKELRDSYARRSRPPV